MDKNAIKKYAVWARNELIARVTQKAEQYEITETKTTPANADSIQTPVSIKASAPKITADMTRAGKRAIITCSIILEVVTLLRI